MKVVVVGGGLIGCLTACRLKQQGAEVVLLEKGKLGQESSWAGAGILCPIHPWLYPDAFTHLVQASLDLYADLEDELLEETGCDIQRIKSGLLIPCFADDVVQHQADAQAWSQRFAWQLARFNGQESRALEPTLSPHVEESLYWHDVYQVRNPALFKAVRLYMQKLGVVVMEDAEVAQLLEGKGGKVCGVSTTEGEQYQSDAVLMASGSWSHDLAAQSGFTLPVLPVKGQVVLLQTKPNTLNHIVKHDDAYFVPRADGRILVGASMEHVGFERGNTVAGIHALLSATLKLLPGLKEANIEQQWMGFRPGSPDGLPFLGPVQAKKGLWLASGHYRNGVALAPITANIMANWMLGEPPSLDMTAFLPERVIQAEPSLGYPKST